MLRKSQTAVSSLLAATLLFSACGKGSNTKTDDADNQNIAQEEPQEEIQDGDATETDYQILYTFEEAKERAFSGSSNSNLDYTYVDNFYIMRGEDAFEEIEPAFQLHEESGHTLCCHDFAVSQISDEDKLVLILKDAEESIDLCPIDKTGYTIPVAFNISGSISSFCNYDFDSETLTPIFKGYGLNNLENAEINGLPINQDYLMYSGADALLCYSSHYNFSTIHLSNVQKDSTWLLPCERNQKVKVSGYEGTIYHEAFLEADYAYFIMKSMLNPIWQNNDFEDNIYNSTFEYEIKIEPTLTKDGYAEIDLSGLSAGYYALRLGYSIREEDHTNDYTIIQIL